MCLRKEPKRQKVTTESLKFSIEKLITCTRHKILVFLDQIRKYELRLELYTIGFAWSLGKITTKNLNTLSLSNPLFVQLMHI